MRNNYINEFWQDKELYRNGGVTRHSAITITKSFLVDFFFSRNFESLETSTFLSIELPKIIFSLDTSNISNILRINKKRLCLKSFSVCLCFTFFIPSIKDDR